MKITYRDLGKNGRLANQIFQITSTIGTAIRFGAEPVFPEWDYNKYFKYKLPTGDINPTHYYHEPYFHYTPIAKEDIVGIQSGAVEMLNLFGYFQSEHYWSHCKQEIFDRLEFNQKFVGDTILKRAHLIFIKNAFWQSCSIHVRRGDYVNNDFYAEIGMDYYNKAIQIIKNNVPDVKFLIFSDDISHCKELFIGEEFIFMEGNSDIEDLFLMSQCAHNIGCNSSFSWWGSYLNKNKNALKCFPKQWFGIAANHDTRDLYLKEWIVL